MSSQQQDAASADTGSTRDDGAVGGIDRRTFMVAGAGALVAAATPLRRARAATAPIKLGVLLPRSGFLALIGQACQRGCDLALPILADMGYSIELMNGDTESSPDVARTQAERLIRDGAQILTGCFDSGATAAVAQVAEQHGIPFVINIGSEDKILQQGYKFVFRNFPTSTMLVTGGLGMMKQVFEATNTAPKTAVFMHVNDSFGMAMLGGITKFLPDSQLPFKIVETISYDPKARDLSIEVAKAKGANADLLMVVTRLNDPIIMVREMVKQQYNPMGIISPGSPGMYERQFFKVLGKYANGPITNIPWFDPKQELNTRLEAAFKKAYPEELYELNCGFSFEAVLIAADAYKRAGSADPQALVEALRKTHLTQRVMLGGVIDFDATGQNTHPATAAVQNLDGEPVVVLPVANQVKKPVFPMVPWKDRA